MLNKKDKRIKKVLDDLIQKNVDMRYAVRELGLSERQIYRKKAAYLKYGEESIPHKSIKKREY